MSATTSKSVMGDKNKPRTKIVPDIYINLLPDFMQFENIAVANVAGAEYLPNFVAYGVTDVLDLSNGLSVSSISLIVICYVITPCDCQCSNVLLLDIVRNWSNEMLKLTGWLFLFPVLTMALWRSIWSRRMRSQSSSMRSLRRPEIGF